MSLDNLCGFTGKIARVDVSTRQVKYEFPSKEILRKFIGGTGLGIYYLYNEVPPGVSWSDPENRFILLSGPLGGTVGPTGLYTVVTKGPMNNGPAGAQANGKFGAFLKFNGLDGLIIQGKAKEPVYLHIQNGEIAIRPSRHLMGKDTWETEEAIERELGKGEKELSVLSVGPAGENLVRFACLMNDRGHIAAHNGPGAVLAAKNIKAIAIERGKYRPAVYDRKAARTILDQIIEDKVKKSPADIFNWGTSKLINLYNETGLLPIKNYSTSEGDAYYKLDGTYYRQRFEMKWVPCWGCRFRHCHHVKVTEGPYKGFVGEEPEYECMAAWGPLIGQTDPGAAVMLSNFVDRLGMDANESGWLIAWVMECYEKGIITKDDTDGLEMTWGNVEAVRQMLENIAYRRGFGSLLAEGVMRAAQSIGGEAVNLGIYTKKGNTPRCHDHRTAMNMILDTVMASIGSDEVSVMQNTPASLGLPDDTDRNTPEGAAAVIAAGTRKGVKILMDSLPICYLGVGGASLAELVQLLNAVTGWDYTAEEASSFVFRIHTLLRSFGVRHGHTKDMDEPSLRYASRALKGPAAGKSLYDGWPKARDDYYRKMGWDVATGIPLPETLKKAGLDFVIPDLYGKS